MRQVSGSSRSMWMGVLTSVVSAAAVTANADTVQLREKYSRTADSGFYKEGQFGKALGLIGGQHHWPLLFNKASVDQGTISIHFKPFMGKKDYAGRPLYVLRLVDGQQSLAVFDYPYWDHVKDAPVTQHVGLFINNAKVRNVALCGANLGTEAHTRFHHLLFTWNTEKAAFYVNGKLVKETNKTNADRWPKPFDAAGTFLELRGDMWVDQLVILSRYATDADIKALQQPWKTGPGTAFCAGFDGDHTAHGFIDGKGQRCQFVSYVGHPDATFRIDEPAEIEFTVVNDTPKPKTFALKGKIDDLDKKNRPRKIDSPHRPRGKIAER